MRAEKFSLVKQGRVKAGHIDVLQMEYILDVIDQVCIQANLNCSLFYFGAPALVWAFEILFIHVA